ncbi:hypothetical protein ACS0TY_005590 [Phlomoides rotata]
MLLIFCGNWMSGRIGKENGTASPPTTPAPRCPTSSPSPPHPQPVAPPQGSTAGRFWRPIPFSTFIIWSTMWARLKLEQSNCISSAIYV